MQSFFLMCDSLIVLFSDYFNFQVSMKNKSLKRSKIRKTNEHGRLVIFKFFFRGLRRSGKTWIEIVDILAEEMPESHDVRSDLLNHYYQGTKVPSPEQLLRILSALSKTKYSPPRLSETVSRMAEYNDLLKIIYNKGFINNEGKEEESYEEYSRNLKKLNARVGRDKIKAFKDVETSLSNLMDLIGNTDMLYDIVDEIIKKLADKNG